MERHMAKVGPDEEVLEFAVARETEAYNFYMALAGRVDSEHMRIVFEELAQEELEHKEKLELEIMKVGRVVSQEQQVTVADHEYIVSDDPSPLDMDYKDMLLLAMEKEEAAFRTYANLLAMIQNVESREVLFALAEEEVKHKLRFQTEYDLLLKQS
jgi:rubrerythrin